MRAAASVVPPIAGLVPRGNKCSRKFLVGDARADRRVNAAECARNRQLLGLGTGLTPGEALDVTLRSASGGTIADTATCSFAFPSADFKGTPAACELTTTATYDSLEAILGWIGATTGTLTLDAVSLIKR